MGTKPAPPFEEVFQRLFDRAYRVAYRILGDPQDAEDSAAEAFARAHASWAKVGGLPYVDAWILRVTSNIAIDTVRRRRSVPSDNIGELAGTAALGDTEEAAIDRVVLVAALARLPRRQREVLALRFLGGLRESDVADCLGCSVGTVKAHTHRGLAALRRVLQPSVLQSAGWA